MTNIDDTRTADAAQTFAPPDSASASKPEIARFPAGLDARAEVGEDGGAGDSARASAEPAQEVPVEKSQAGEAIVKSLADGAHGVIDKLAGFAGPAVDRLTGAFASSSDDSSKLVGQAGGKVDAWVGDVRDIIRENPIAAIATALAVGVIYVKLTASPRRGDRDLDE